MEPNSDGDPQYSSSHHYTVSESQGTGSPERAHIPSIETPARRGGRMRSRVQRQREMSRRDFIHWTIATVALAAMANEAVGKLFSEETNPTPPTVAPTETQVDDPNDTPSSSEQPTTHSQPSVIEVKAITPPPAEPTQEKGAIDTIRGWFGSKGADESKQSNPPLITRDPNGNATPDLAEYLVRQKRSGR